MSLIDRLYAIGPVRKFLWRRWYSFLTLRLGKDNVDFLNYAYEEEPPMALPLSQADEQNRGCIQLYHHVAAQADLRGKDVLEVSCGHGGGAAYLVKTFEPRRYVGLDLNPRGVRRCERAHATPVLNFVEGDAEALPFPAGSFDYVINVEASHCYASFPKFLNEVARVLRPTGRLLYADFRFSPDIAPWETALRDGPLEIEQQQDISASVLRGMAMNSLKSQSLIRRHLPKSLHKLGGDFAGVKGSRIYQALEKGELTYRSYCFSPREPAGAGADMSGRPAQKNRS